MISAVMTDYSDVEASSNAFFPQLTSPVRQVTSRLLHEFADLKRMQAIKSDEAHVFCFETEENTLIGHIFAGSKMEVLLRHHHQREKDDLLLFTCHDFLANKPFMQKKVHYADFPDLRSLKGKEALRQGKILLAIDEAKETSQQRLSQAIGNLKKMQDDRKNFSYRSEGISKADIAPFMRYFS